ncbi:hypothetical protein [Flagellimonas beolgyonensis]|jgi:hypothetical protein|uniref:hypothetical protein n=1 Tax=Flagellimonas beolgyonensis TaxID=864064 RepID=UPI000F8D18E6|nr:hypothetical protein [Allomuricauda beolgyonensis]
METKELTQTTTDQRTIELVKGLFTPTEASDVIISLIDEKINFHKIQRLKIWEGNHHSKTNLLDNRIEELEQEKATARRIVDMARSQGKNVRISGILKMHLED